MPGAGITLAAVVDRIHQRRLRRRANEHEPPSQLNPQGQEQVNEGEDLPDDFDMMPEISDMPTPSPIERDWTVLDSSYRESTERAIESSSSSAPNESDSDCSADIWNKDGTITHRFHRSRRNSEANGGVSLVGYQHAMASAAGMGPAMQPSGAQGARSNRLFDERMRLDGDGGDTEMDDNDSDDILDDYDELSYDADGESDGMSMSAESDISLLDISATASTTARTLEQLEVEEELVISSESILPDPMETGSDQGEMPETPTPPQPEAAQPAAAGQAETSAAVRGNLAWFLSPADATKNDEFDIWHLETDPQVQDEESKSSAGRPGTPSPETNRFLTDGGKMYDQQSSDDTDDTESTISETTPKSTSQPPPTAAEAGTSPRQQAERPTTGRHDRSRLLQWCGCRQPTMLEVALAVMSTSRQRASLLSSSSLHPMIANYIAERGPRSSRTDRQPRDRRRALFGQREMQDPRERDVMRPASYWLGRRERRDEEVIIDDDDEESASVRVPVGVDAHIFDAVRMQPNNAPDEIAFFEEVEVADAGNAGNADGADDEDAWSTISGSSDLSSSSDSTWSPPGSSASSASSTSSDSGSSDSSSSSSSSSESSASSAHDSGYFSGNDDGDPGGPGGGGGGGGAGGAGNTGYTGRFYIPPAFRDTAFEGYGHRHGYGRMEIDKWLMDQNGTSHRRPEDDTTFDQDSDEDDLSQKESEADLSDDLTDIFTRIENVSSRENEPSQRRAHSGLRGRGRGRSSSEEEEAETSFEKIIRQSREESMHDSYQQQQQQQQQQQPTNKAGQNRRPDLSTRYNQPTCPWTRSNGQTTLDINQSTSSEQISTIRTRQAHSTCRWQKPTSRTILEISQPTSNDDEFPSLPAIPRPSDNMQSTTETFRSILEKEKQKKDEARAAAEEAKRRQVLNRKYPLSFQFFLIKHLATVGKCLPAAAKAFVEFKQSLVVPFFTSLQRCSWLNGQFREIRLEIVYRFYPPPGSGRPRQTTRELARWITMMEQTGRLGDCEEWVEDDYEREQEFLDATRRLGEQAVVEKTGWEDMAEWVHNSGPAWEDWMRARVARRREWCSWFSLAN